MINNANELVTALNNYQGADAYNDLGLYNAVDEASDDGTEFVIDGERVVWDAPAGLWRIA